MTTESSSTARSLVLRRAVAAGATLAAALAMSAIGASAWAAEGVPGASTATEPAAPNPAAPNTIPPEAARVVGQPVVFRLTTTQESGLGFVVVAKMTGRVKALNAYLNAYGQDAEQVPLLVRREVPCYITKYSGIGKRRGQRIVWTFPEEVADLVAGSKATATVIDVSEPEFLDVSRPLPPEASFAVKVQSPRGRIKTRTGQYSLRNKRAQRALKSIGCAGRIRPQVLRY